MTTSEQINELAKALSAAQGVMRPAVKDSTNPHYKSKYADLAANVEAARGALATNGLAIVQEATLTERGVAVTTCLLHSSGQWVRFEPLTVPLQKPDAHGVGSATSYARRYALGAALNLVADDDDGNQAVQQAALAKPEGYDEWLLDFLACADEGTEALRAMFKKSLPALREYLTRHDGAHYDQAKQKAAAADKTLAGVK